MTFALNHDDGQSAWDLKNADVVLIGVSRTSKTPTCIYLANRGIKAANVPIVPGVPLPQELRDLEPATGPLDVGLTHDPASLVQNRKNRLRLLAAADDPHHVDPETRRTEVEGGRTPCTAHASTVPHGTRTP